MSLSQCAAPETRGASYVSDARSDGPYYQDGTGCEGTLLSGRRRDDELLQKLRNSFVLHSQNIRAYAVTRLVQILRLDHKKEDNTDRTPRTSRSSDDFGQLH